MKCISKTGFTLIELLVVIAIISVLAGFLFPVFASTREKARQIVCISNARQMGTALQEYLQDNDDRFMTRHDNDAGDPWAQAPDPNPADFQTWYDWVQPYINSYAVERCPSYTGPYPMENDTYSTTGALIKRYSKSNYLISDNVINQYGVAKGFIANIPNVSSTLLIAESPSGATCFSDGGTGFGPTSTNLGPTAVDDLLYPTTVNGQLSGSGSMHFVQYIPNVINPDSGVAAISAQVTCIAVDGHAKSVLMNNANEGGVTQVGNIVLDQPGGYGGLYVTGPNGELTIPFT